MNVTIYGTNWCEDTRRARAFVAARSIRPTFVDIEARPHKARGLSIDGAPLRIPIVIIEGVDRLDEPTDAELEAAFADGDHQAPIHHRTALNPSLHRFEQFRNDELVASADFVERDGRVLITGTTHHVDVDAELADENLQRLTSGLVEIAQASGRTVDVELRATDDSPPAPEAAAPEATAPEARPTDTCPLSQHFAASWSNGDAPADAVRLAAELQVGRLATIKALHEFWEMPLTPDAMTIAFTDPAPTELAPMFHVLAWILQQNPGATMSELEAFDSATGVSQKTFALSRAGRPRDAIALVDRMGPGLTLRPISEEHALAAASEAIRADDGALRIQSDSTLRFPFGWIFLYQSVEYLETGDYSTMISGNAPLLVDRFTGALWVTGTAERPNVYAENYAATGDPRQASPHP